MSGAIPSPISFLVCLISFLLLPCQNDQALLLKQIILQNGPESQLVLTFRVARSTSVLQQAPGPSSSLNSTLFITVNKRRGNLKEGQTRVFSNTPEPPAHSDLPEPAVDIQHDDPLPLDEESPPVVESPDSKPKRKRYTKNVVSYYSGFWA